MLTALCRGAGNRREEGGGGDGHGRREKKHPSHVRWISLVSRAREGEVLFFFCSLPPRNFCFFLFFLSCHTHRENVSGGGCFYPQDLIMETACWKNQLLLMVMILLLVRAFPLLSISDLESKKWEIIRLHSRRKSSCPNMSLRHQEPLSRIRHYYYVPL